MGGNQCGRHPAHQATSLRQSVLPMLNFSPVPAAVLEPLAPPHTLKFTGLDITEIILNETYLSFKNPKRASRNTFPFTIELYYVHFPAHLHPHQQLGLTHMTSWCTRTLSLTPDSTNGNPDPTKNVSCLCS